MRYFVIDLITDNILYETDNDIQAINYASDIKYNYEAERVLLVAKGTKERYEVVWSN